MNETIMEFNIHDKGAYLTDLQTSNTSLRTLFILYNNSNIVDSSRKRN